MCFYDTLKTRLHVDASKRFFHHLVFGRHTVAMETHEAQTFCLSVYVDDVMISLLSRLFTSRAPQPKNIPLLLKPVRQSEKI